MNIKVIGGVAVAVVAAIFLVALIDSAMSDDPSDPEPGPIYNTTYDGNGGVTSDGKTTINSTETKILENMFTKGKYSFLRWDTKVDGTGVPLNPGHEALGGGTIYAIWGSTFVCNAITLPDNFYIFTSHHSDFTDCDKYDDELLSGESYIYTESHNISVLLGNNDDASVVLGDVSADYHDVHFEIKNAGESTGFYVAHISIDGAPIEGVRLSDNGVGIVFKLGSYSGEVKVSLTLERDI